MLGSKLLGSSCETEPAGARRGPAASQSSGEYLVYPDNGPERYSNHTDNFFLAAVSCERGVRERAAALSGKDRGPRAPLGYHTKVIEIEHDVIRRDVTAFANNAHSITFWWWCDTILSEYVYSVKSVMLTQN